MFDQVMDRPSIKYEQFKSNNEKKKIKVRSQKVHINCLCSSIKPTFEGFCPNARDFTILN